MIFEIFILIRFIAKLNNSSSKAKMFSFPKGNWAHLAEKTSQPEAKIAIIFKLSESILMAL